MLVNMWMVVMSVAHERTASARVVNARQTITGREVAARSRFGTHTGTAQIGLV
ncbi:hypothetical protein HNR67_006963 [Crossiella cryophila]|uniref:Uncharacterized protein n=1 Tax=Crossiella cryophila TaxID=43355 RepID=A0A7W7CGJ7_9PSEU|nr:hypothetical protein [Crossiella cryophila]